MQSLSATVCRQTFSRSVLLSEGTTKFHTRMKRWTKLWFTVTSSWGKGREGENGQRFLILLASVFPEINQPSAIKVYFVFPGLGLWPRNEERLVLCCSVSARVQHSERLTRSSKASKGTVFNWATIYRLLKYLFLRKVSNGGASDRAGEQDGRLFSQCHGTCRAAATNCLAA